MNITVWLLLTTGLVFIGVGGGACATFAAFSYGLRTGRLAGVASEHDHWIDLLAGILDWRAGAWQAADSVSAAVQEQVKRQAADLATGVYHIAARDRHPSHHHTDTDPRLYLTDDPYQTPTLLLAVPAPSAVPSAASSCADAPGGAVARNHTDTPPWELPEESISTPGVDPQHDQPTMPIASRSAPTVPLPGLAKRETARRVWQRGWQRSLPPIPHG